MIKILAILLTLVSISAFAAPPIECESVRCIELTWDLPTEREDGSQIDTIDRFDLHVVVDNVFQNVVEVAGDSSDYYLVGAEAGNYEFKIRTVEDGYAGDYTSIVGLIINGKPLPPNNLKAKKTTTTTITTTTTTTVSE